jgi:hypothetical protein
MAAKNIQHPIVINLEVVDDKKKERIFSSAKKILLLNNPQFYNPYFDTVCTGLQAQCNATGVTPNSRSRLSLRVVIVLEFSVSDTAAISLRVVWLSVAMILDVIG